MLVIGHRGAAGLVPENTLPSFVRAIELGVDYIECDVRLSRDGHAVIMHDAAVDRTTNGTGPVAELDLEELHRLDAGDGERIPALGEILQLVEEQGVAALVEVKAEEAIGPTVDAVLGRDLVEQVVVTGKLKIVKAVKAIDSKIQVGVPFHTPSRADLEMAAELGAQGVGIHFTALRPDHLEACLELGLVARAWNPTTREEIEATLALSPDGVTSDRPDLVLELLGRTKPTG